MKDYSYCPYRHHNGLLLECNYCDALCKKTQCPYFLTVKDAQKAYHEQIQSAVELGTELIDKMKKNARLHNKTN